MPSEFTEINSLPNPKSKFSTGNRDLDARSEKSAFNVCRHIIYTFIVVDKPWIGFWNELVYKGLKVFADRWICVFIDA